jgi:protocatechuate 3,4-dioxygenase beta subunit
MLTRASRKRAAIEKRGTGTDDLIGASSASATGVAESAAGAGEAGPTPIAPWVDASKLPGSGARFPIVRLDPQDLVLEARADVDPLTGVAPETFPGKPPELAIAAYVARGRSAADGAVELVGPRTPAVEEGVPVAFSGRVVEAEDRKPIAGARVTVSSTFYVRRYFYDHHLREVASALTDGDGRWTIERLNIDPAHFGSGGRLSLSVTADGHAPELAVPITEVSPGVANKLPEVALARAAETLRGRVVDMWEGQPVVGARVYATGAVSPLAYPKDERPALFVGAPTVLTDADGRFTLEGLARGLQTISVHGPDDCIGWMETRLPLADELTIQARALRGRVEGTTVDDRGEPIALVTITCRDNSTHSFADGRFALENFRGDDVTIWFAHPDYAPVVREKVPDKTVALVVRMERRRPEIVLDVRDRDTSAAVPRIHLEFAFAEGAAPPPPTSPERLAADGRYRVRLPDGAASATVTAPGRAAETVPLAGLSDGDRVAVTLASVAEK